MTAGKIICGPSPCVPSASGPPHSAPLFTVVLGDLQALDHERVASMLCRCLLSVRASLITDVGVSRIRALGLVIARLHDASTTVTFYGADAPGPRRRAGRPADARATSGCSPLLTTPWGPVPTPPP